MPTTQVKCSIIGAGKVGLSLALALHKKDLLDWIYDIRDINSFGRELDLLKEKLINSYNSISNIPEIVFLTVPDDKIELALDEFLNTKPDLNGKLIVHTAGSMNSDILKNARIQSALTASAHPYQTFIKPQPELFQGISWAVESKDKIQNLIEIIKSLGSNPYQLPPEIAHDKVVYHASAVVASNYIHGLMELSKNMADLAGIPAKDFIKPIVETSIENNMKATQDIPITGPMVRGDISAIERQIDSLKNTKFLKPFLYYSLGTLEVVFNSSKIDKEIYEKLKQLLNDSL